MGLVFFNKVFFQQGFFIRFSILSIIISCSNKKLCFVCFFVLKFYFFVLTFLFIIDFVAPLALIGILFLYGKLFFTVYWYCKSYFANVCFDFPEKLRMRTYLAGKKKNKLTEKHVESIEQLVNRVAHQFCICEF